MGRCAVHHEGRQSAGQQEDRHRIQFKPTPGNLYPNAAPDKLVVRVQPNDAMCTQTNAKLPGMEQEVDQVELDITYGFNDVRLPLAYERLIFDVMRGGHSLFVRDDELKHAWKLFDPLLEAIDKKTIPVHINPRGSCGPAQEMKWLRAAALFATSDANVVIPRSDKGLRRRLC